MRVRKPWDAETEGAFTDDGFACGHGVCGRRRHGLPAGEPGEELRQHIPEGANGRQRRELVREHGLPAAFEPVATETGTGRWFMVVVRKPGAGPSGAGAARRPRY